LVSNNFKGGVKMRKQLIFLLVIAMTSGVQAVETLTEEYHVWGHLHGPYMEYNIQDVVPVSGSVEFKHNYAWSRAGRFFVEVGSNDIPGYLPDPPYQYGGGAVASAEVSWTFRPEEAWFGLSFHLPLYWYDPVTVELMDLTDNHQLFSYNGIADTLYVDYLAHGSTPYWYSVNPTHEYSLYVKLNSSASNDGEWYGIISAHEIPAPSALLLSSIGIGLVTWLRRRRTI